MEIVIPFGLACRQAAYYIFHILQAVPEIRKQPSFHILGRCCNVLGFLPGKYTSGRIQISLLLWFLYTVLHPDLSSFSPIPNTLFLYISGHVLPLFFRTIPAAAPSCRGRPIPALLPLQPQAGLLKTGQKKDVSNPHSPTLSLGRGRKETTPSACFFNDAAMCTSPRCPVLQFPFPVSSPCGDARFPLSLPLRSVHPCTASYTPLDT